MIMKYGNLMEALNSYTDVCITTNSFVKKDGTLVMGRGFAKQMADWNTRIPWFAGQEILQWNQEFSRWDGLTEIKGKPDPYGFLRLNEFERFCASSGRNPESNPRIHLFQVKEYWGDDATLELVKRSVDMMKAHVLGTERFGRTFALNYPAIGNGKLRKSDVEPIIAELPDNVHIWQYHEDPWSDEALGDDAEIDRYADEQEDEYTNSITPE